MTRFTPEGWPAFGGRRLRLIVGFYAICSLGLTAGAFIFPHSQKVELTGVLAPDGGYADVVAPRQGTVERLFVKEGDDVAYGAPVALIGDPLATSGGVALGELREANVGRRGGAAAVVERANRAAEEQELQSVSKKRSGIERQLSLLDSQRRLYVSQGEVQQQRVDNLERLAADGFVSKVQLQNARDAVLSSELRLIDLRREVESLHSQLSEIDAQGASLRVRIDRNKAAEARERAALSDVELSAAPGNKFMLIAPVQGRVGSVAVKLGARARPGEALATIVPHGSRLEAHMGAPADIVPYLKPGTEVQISYVVASARSEGGLGHIVSISEVPVKFDLRAPGGGAAQYAVRIRLNNDVIMAREERLKLRPGMTVKAKVTIATKPIVAWILGV
ncbi:HlyD family efflux transporter periplasmic adaptor subunit [Caulobacter segnis]|uniref:HlyD family secretion protein n=1 Tax=Caulobacter segnis TaxID=88688 RepID=UPI00240F6656|nr:HlyD family efflux transporter periplasmic adaptor subunit [Caulobacter segnis]MDG2520816.1 HlyD family efflux transporter periplasmic adaptor subunit [Caulobacter segnis]